MPAPVEPQGPAVWEEILKNPTVKSVLNTTAREITRSIFGTGRRRRK
ncbi:AAA ATPase [Mycobacterium tuberculosis]|nr:AAA ATPase [Mycobacterium tuberculosis]CKT77953.1 AAA ATPase [Mycobacterium tuberculosis]CNU97362.1 AAA ATPase [Mycobacterium tuberculosis]COZ70466.1 AAA ATPase [Mycobacterium tuberculosis]CPB61251.1 AAA ATPase [Mycobacterium tuberculosis]